MPPEVRPSFVSQQVTEARRYYLDLKPKSTAEVTVVCGGCERVQPDYLVERRTFPYYAVEFVAEGEGTLIASGKEWRLRPGVAFAYGPGIPHTIRTHPERPMLKYYVDFVGRRAAQLLRASPIKPGQVAQISAPGEVRAIFEDLQRNGQSEPPHGPAICGALLPVLLLKLTEKAIPYGASDPRALASYHRIRSFLETHYLELDSLEETAERCGVSLSYLCRLFQRFDHQTPYRYLLRLRMNHAARLLLDTRKLVKEVAAEMGFTDPFNFSRTFKGCFGISPGAFLRQNPRH